jgi:hypothetical protein
MALKFNDKVNPKAKTEFFKIYADVSESGIAPEYELQGRGVGSWTITSNASVNKTNDVLGMVDMERENSQPTQSFEIKLRKGSKFAEILTEAFFKNKTSRIDAMTILQKLEFIDGEAEGTCFARLEKDVLVELTSFTGEAGGYLGFEGTFHYANNTVYGTMPKVDGETIVFTPDTEAESEPAE